MEFAVPASLLCLAQNANRTVNLSIRFRLSTFIPGLAFWAFLISEMRRDSLANTTGI